MAQPSVGYNIFARELEAILEVHGARLGKLNDHPDVQLHPQLVRRLQISLMYPKPLVTLNPDDLERVMKVYSMTLEESTRLKAAVLATAVERVLMDRIEASTALMAANAVFRILREALQNEVELTGIRGDRGDTAFLPPLEADEGASQLDVALETYDAGILELYVAEETPPAARTPRLRQVVRLFLLALEQLDQCAATDKITEAWRYWQGEAKRALAQARASLESEE